MSVIQDMVNEAVDSEIASEVVGPASEGTAVALLGPLMQIEIGLAALRVESDEASWDVETAKGEAAAREFRARCVKVRASADAAYEQGNKPLLSAQRQARDLVKKIQGFVQPIELRWDALIKAKEQRKAAEKAEREQAERARIAAIRERIAAISARPAQAAGCDSAIQIAKLLVPLEHEVITEEHYGEFVDEAEGARMRSLAAVRQLYEATLAREAEAARLLAERLELQRQQAELAAQQEAVRAEQVRQQQIAEAQRLAVERAQAERIAAERAEQARLDAEARARREAESAELKRQQDAFEEERRIAREQIAAEQRKLREAEAARKAEAAAAAAAVAAAEAEAEAAAAAEADARIRAANAELAAQQKALDEAQAKASAPKLSVVATTKVPRPSDAEILSVLCSAYGAPAEEVLVWIASFKVSKEAQRLQGEAA